MLSKDLKKLGFSKNLTKVYLELIKQGEAKARGIIEETGLHRNIVYDKLDQLVDKNLATIKKDSGVNVYQVLDPSRLMEEVKRKEKLTKNIIEEINTIHQPKEQEILVREGKDELKQSLFSMYYNIDKNQEWKVLGSSSRWFDILSKEDHKELINTHKEKGVLRKVITSSIHPQEEKHKEQVENYYLKTIPEITAETTEFHIFEDKVISTILVDPYSVIEIKNEEFVKSYQNYFDLLWKQEVFMYRGWKEISDLLMNKMLPSLNDGDEEKIIATYSEGEVSEKISKMFVEYNQKLKDKDVTKNFLAYGEETERVRKEMKKGGTTPQTKVKRLPEEHRSVLNFQIYPDYVVSFVWSDEPVAILFTQEDIVRGYHDQFDLLWSMAEE